jgi:hypothetical protein
MQSRFAMSYLRGPLTKAQIGQLMASRKIEFEHVTQEALPTSGPSRYLPAFPDGVPVQFAPVPAGTTLDPYVFGEADVAYEDKTTGAFVQEHLLLSVPVSQWPAVDWTTAEQLPEGMTWLDKVPEGVLFEEVPADLQKPASWKTLTARFKDVLKVRPLTLLTSKPYKVAQQDGETEGQFMARLGVLSAPDITGAVNKVLEKLEEKQHKLQDDLTEAQQRLNIAQMEARNRSSAATMQTAEAFLGLLVGRKRSFTAGARTRGTAQTLQEKARDLQQKVNDLQQQVAVLAAQTQATVMAEEQAARAKYLAVEAKQLRPKVSNVVIKRVGIVFR